MSCKDIYDFVRKNYELENIVEERQKAPLFCGFSPIAAGYSIIRGLLMQRISTPRRGETFSRSPSSANTARSIATKIRIQR